MASSSSSSSSSFSLLSSLVLMMVLCAVTSFAWLEEDEYPWIRGTRSCAYTGHNCDSVRRCCSDQDTCVTSVGHDVTGGVVRFSTCRNLRKEIMTMQPRLPKGAACTDSRECIDLCCREYRMHRHRPSFRCGPQRDSIMSHTCILPENK